MNNRKVLPPWLQEVGDWRLIKDPGERHSKRYHLTIWKHTPGWVDYKAINKIYAECVRLRKQGFDVVVDHIVPLNGQLVSGLHCRANLRIMPRVPNATKSNLFWPDMPHTQPDFFPQELVPEFFFLEPSPGCVDKLK